MSDRPTVRDVLAAWGVLLNDRQAEQLLEEMVEAVEEHDDTQCGCGKCNPTASYMIVCSECGNKRCPKATDHDLACTRSNKPGQKGSSWENYHIPKEHTDE